MQKPEPHWGGAGIAVSIIFGGLTLAGVINKSAGWFGVGVGVTLLVVSFFRRDLPPDPQPPSVDDLTRAATRQRLLVLAQAAIDLAAAAKSDEEFGNSFYNDWRHEQVALREFLQSSYGIKVRGWWLDAVPHLSDAQEFAAALQNTAQQLDHYL